MSHDHTRIHHTRYNYSGQGIGLLQKSLPEKTQHLEKTDVLAPGGIRNISPKKQAAPDTSLRQRDHRDRLTENNSRK